MLLSFRSLATVLTVGASVLVSSGAWAQDDQPFTPKQQEALKKIVHDTIVENPSIITEAIDALREKEQLAAEMEAKKALVDHKDEIYNDTASPVLGNPKGDVTVVEFFDYRCPYCKSLTDGLFETVKRDGNVRVVMKELPVLGPESMFAARAALASVSQKKYETFHRNLMHFKGQLGDDAVMKIAASTGLNVEKLKKDMEDPAIDHELTSNAQLASELNLHGTPAFIFGDQVVPGAISPQSMKQLIDQVRHPAKN